MAQTYNISDVMLSYSRKDKDFVQRLEQALRVAGREVWIDWEDIAPTVDWWAEIKAGIEAAHTFVFIMSPNSVRSDVCRQEIEHAVANGKRVIPVLYEDITDPADKPRIHSVLNQHNWIYMRPGDNFDEGFKKLVTALETDMVHAQAHTRLLVRAHEWEENGGGTSRLLRGDDLRAAENWLATGLNKSPEPTALQAKYIAYSRKIANRNRQIVMGAALTTMFLLGLLALFGLDRATVAASEADNALTQAAIAQEQAAIAKTQEGAAINNLATANAAEGQRQLADDARMTQQQRANDSQSTAFYEQTNAYDSQATAASGATNAYVLQVTSDGASTQAMNLQITAGTNAGNLQLTAQYAGTQAAKQAQSAAMAGTQAAGAGTQAAVAGAQAALAQQTANANGTSAANAQGTAVANAGTAQAAAMTVTASYKLQLTADANARTATSVALTAIVANAKASQAALTATSAAETSTSAASTANANATTAAIAAQTATKVGADAQSLNLMNIAQNVLATDRGLAIHLALLAVDRLGASQNPSVFIESILNNVVYTVGSYGEPLTGHAGGVNSVAFSPDGTKIVSGATDNKVLLWDAHTGSLIKEFTGHTGAVTSVAFSPDGTQIVSGSLDNKVLLWNINQGPPIKEFTGHTDDVTGVAVSPDGTQIISGSKSGQLILWTHTSGGSYTFPIQGGVMSVAFSSDTDLNTPGSQTYIAAGYNNGKLILWDTTTKVNIYTFSSSSSQPVTGVAFSPDGKKIVSGSYNGKLALYNIESKQRLDFTTPLAIYANTSVAFSPDGSKIASTLYTGDGLSTVMLWSAKTGEAIGTPFIGHSERATSVAFNHDSSKIVSGSQDSTLRLWDTTIGFSIGDPLQAPDGIYSLAVGDNIIVSGLSGGEVIVWDIAQGKSKRSFKGHTDTVTSVALSKDGATVISASQNGQLIYWSAADGQIIHTFTGTGVVSDVAFNSEGTWIMWSSGITVNIWNTVSKKITHTFEATASINSIALNKNGTQLVAGLANNTLVLWNVADQRPVFTFEGHTKEITSVAFSNDGTKIVSGSHDNTLRLWDASIGKPIGNAFTGHVNPVYSVAISPDGTRILSGSSDLTVRLWDANTGQQIGSTLKGGTDAVTGVGFSPDGTKFASGAYDSTIRIWANRKVPALAQWACDNRYARPLTQAEKVIYFNDANYPDHRCSAQFPIAGGAANMSMARAVAPQQELLPQVTETLAAISQAVLTLPLYASMDDGAPDWSVEGSWTLSDADRYGEAGAGWIVSGMNGESRLAWQALVDLSGSSLPHLTFQSRLGDYSALGMVQINANNGEWQLLETVISTTDWMTIDIDLSAYRDQHIALRFVWLPGTDAAGAWAIDEVRLDDQGLIAATETATPTATLDVLATPTLDITMTETPTATATLGTDLSTPVMEMWTLTPSPTFTELAPTATLMPAPLPVFAPMENGAPGWLGSVGWLLNDSARYGDMGQGWSVLASDQPMSVLDWTQPIDLRMAYTPRLRFQSQMRSLQPSAMIQISVDGVTWQFLSLAGASDTWTEIIIDLSAYRGQVVYLQWVWLSPADDASAFWMIDHVMIDEAPILPTPTQIWLPTDSPTATWVPTEMPSATAFPTETETPTMIPTDIPVEMPAVEITQEPS